VTAAATVVAAFGGRFSHAGHRPLRIVVLLLFIALIVAVVWLVVREVRRRRNQPVMAGAAPAPTLRTPTPAGYDDALEQLRLRYVRGEIEREEYLQKVQDLGGPPPPV
jgi:putative membrane protein